MLFHDIHVIFDLTCRGPTWKTCWLHLAMFDMQWKYQHTIHPSIHTCPALRSVEGLVPLLAIIERRPGTHWTSQCEITRQISDQYNSRGINVYHVYYASTISLRLLYSCQDFCLYCNIQAVCITQKWNIIFSFKTGIGFNEVHSIFSP